MSGFLHIKHSVSPKLRVKKKKNRIAVFSKFTFNDLKNV